MRRLAKYIHELLDWPKFVWQQARFSNLLADVRHRQGRLTGHREALGFSLRQEAVLRTLTDDVLKSSEIEGEKLDADQVRSSIARRLGMDIGALKPTDRDIEGVVENAPYSTRVRAAECVMNHTMKAVEIEDVEARYPIWRELPRYPGPAGSRAGKDESTLSDRTSRSAHAQTAEAIYSLVD